MPTLLNNVETFANLPGIIRKGPEWFATIGTPKSTGAKGAIIISAGFSELGEEGRQLEREILSIAWGKLRIIGPNCLGVISPLWLQRQLQRQLRRSYAERRLDCAPEPERRNLHFDSGLGPRGQHWL